MTELVKGTVTYFPCDQWLDKDEGDGQIRRQLMATKKATDTRKGNLIVFELQLTPFLSRLLGVIGKVSASKGCACRFLISFT